MRHHFGLSLRLRSPAAVAYIHFRSRKIIEDIPRCLATLHNLFQCTWTLQSFHFRLVRLSRSSGWYCIVLHNTSVKDFFVLSAITIQTIVNNICVFILIGAYFFFFDFVLLTRYYLMVCGPSLHQVNIMQHFFPLPFSFVSISVQYLGSRSISVQWCVQAYVNLV